MKNIFTIAVVIAACSILMSSCDKKAKDTKTVSANEAPVSATVKIGYVDLDSLMAHYQYYLDCSDLLEKKSKSISVSLNNKGIALHKEMTEFQEKVQKGSITQEEAAKIQTSLQNKQTQLQNLQQSLSEEFQKEQQKYNAALHDSIDNFLKSYNKTAGYTYILSRSNDNILYAEPKFNITNDVIEGLNKRYKK